MMAASEQPDRRSPTRPANPAGRPVDGISLRLARWVRRAVLPFALLCGFVLYVCFGTIRVPAGMDTTPAIPPGSLCIVDKRAGQAAVGHAVFVDLPKGGTLLTRVAAIDAQGRLVLRNDRADSELPDSRQFGPLPRSSVRGVVLCVFPGEGEPGEVIRGR
jgi:hypothetical protein